MEPILKTQNPEGAPEISDEQYNKWLDEMRAFLRTGNTLWYAMDKANLLTHKDSIYRKYRLKDQLCEKVEALQANVGEMINAVGYKVIEAVHTRIVETDGKTQLTSEEAQVWKTMAEKHRTAQPFFVSRTETAVADPNQVGKILDTIESTNYEQLGPEIKKQSVAPNAPIQNQGQDGATGDVSAKQPTA